MFNNFTIFRPFSAEAASAPIESLSYPPPANDDKTFPPKIQNLVNEISKLSLLEVVDLNDCLKVRFNDATRFLLNLFISVQKTLKIEAMPMAMAGGFAAPAAKSADVSLSW